MAAIEALQAEGRLTIETPVIPQVTRTKDKAHGDFASNIPMVLAKFVQLSPRELAQLIIENTSASDLIEKIEIAGPGFINFYLNSDVQRSVLETIETQGEAYGRSNVGLGQRLQVEFVSANPTGPLHVGHGRGAAYGATLANLLSAVGYEVSREYYVNDAGRQMEILATSVWLRYLELSGEELVFPANGYKGDYVWDIAASLHREHGNSLSHRVQTVFEGVTPDITQGGDKELHIDALIARAKELLTNHYQLVFDLALHTILGDIRNDLEGFAVTYDEWFSESDLMGAGAVENMLKRLEDAGHVYQHEGAKWFRSSAFGDEKDRVLVRENGQTTYFASDIAYHANKLERGFVQIIDIWGADHHGYVPRVRAALQALGYAPERLSVLLVQFANLYRQGEKQQMSTRSGEFVTLRELRKEVGKDAARFFYVMRRCEQHLDFDIDLAKSESADNPVYYVQYAHARVCSIFHQLEQKSLSYEPKNSDLTLLTESHEQDLIVSLVRYPEVLHSAAINREPHQLATYLRELANYLHTYYNAHQFIVEETLLRNARLRLVSATRQVLRNGLILLDVSAPEKM